MIKLFSCFPIALEGIIFLLLPKFIPRGNFFAVPVAADFDASPQGRQILSSFRRSVVIALALCLLLNLAWPPKVGFGDLAGVLLLIVLFLAAFFRAYRQTAPFEASTGRPRVLEVSVEPDRLPLSLWLGVGPLLILLLSALYLHFHWNEIPQKSAIHWDLAGKPNGWQTNTIKGVYGFIFFGAELSSLFLVFALLPWFFARRSEMQNISMRMMFALSYLLAVVFSLVSLLPVLHIPAWLVVAIAIAPLPMLMLYLAKLAAEPSDPPEKTPPECWKAGVFYYNPADPALFVTARAGNGYALNFAHPVAWAIPAGLLLVIATAPFILF